MATPTATPPPWPHLVDLEALDLLLEDEQAVLCDHVSGVGDAGVPEDLQHQAVVAVETHGSRLLLGDILICNKSSITCKFNVPCETITIVTMTITIVTDTIGMTTTTIAIATVTNVAAHLPRPPGGAAVAAASSWWG